MVRSTTRMRGWALLESDGVIDHGEDGVGDDDEDNPGEHRRGSGEPHRGGSPYSQHGAEAPRDGDEHAKDHALEEARGKVTERGGGPRVVPVGNPADLEHADAHHGATGTADEDWA